MSKIFMKKSLNSLLPMDRMADEALSKLKVNDVVQVEFAKPRNIKFHRWWWALMTIVADNMDGDFSPEVVCEVIKVRVGHVTVVRTKKGECFIPQSISFAKMDETQFREFVDKAIKVIVSEIIPGVNSDGLRAEVENILGGSR